MNRSYRDYNSSSAGNGGGRTTPVVSSQQHHRRGNSFTAISKKCDENLDLFSRSRRTVSLTPDHHSDVSLKLGKISVGSVKLPARNGLDDLLASSDGGKHDYDWLLTPPETPLCAASERTEFQPSIATPRNRSATRSTSTTKPSRLSTAQLDSSHSSRPARSSSVTRSSIASTINNTYSSNRPSSILNTSSASVSSYIRSSSPITRSSSSSRPSTPSTRTTSSRSSTPSKARSTSSISSSDKTRPSQNSRPSTPNSRPQVSSNSSYPVTRSNSRPSTPIRRSPSFNSLAAPSLSVSTGRVMSNGRSQTSTSRPSSPSPRARPQQPVIPPDFPLDTPPNLRTTLPDRPISAGRSRPGAGLTSKVNSETPSSVNMPRRPSSPVVSRGRSAEPHGRGHLHSNGHNADVSEPRKSTYVSDSMRKPVKASTTMENGMGRTISKKSLDMAIRHMDIRNGSASMRPLPSTSLFPQSIRSAPSKIQTTHGSGSPTSVNSNGSPSVSSNGSILENGIYANGFLENGKKDENGRLFGRLTGADMYESTRYDAILLKEDLKNTTWLHSVDDMSDQCSIFENGFEPLPEPFGLS
ncbi:hypothetical protein BVRB_7g156700 [Beta vulgaris subsp. vulgaris]|uniref:uncharacterized protein LOC104898125 n=1 Tax=Beta vulgaris subsp. vulgaris TaxID=3555 RepID=UPI00053F32C6|nr:uncharacterized protein LOC104898125 [Beta vulgaris subsp. vulgaris]KMT06494.1 hypothetical protein BVRB_7g156700 [Beta vulgaris subsp. vulgaris]